jgi:hypothetical protein
MSIVTITTTETAVRVVSPYNANFVASAKSIGGKWSSDAWVFDIRDEHRVRELCRDIYGDDGLAADLVTLKIEWVKDGFADKGPITVAGRPIARAFGRDSGAKLAEGIVNLAGEFGSGGSMKNWGTTVDAGTIVLVRDFPRAKAEELVAGNNDSARRIYSIEDEAPIIDRAALEAERERLLKRLDEINKLLQA